MLGYGRPDRIPSTTYDLPTMKTTPLYLAKANMKLSDTTPGYNVSGLNLGAETPYIPGTPAAEAPPRPSYTSVPQRPATWRSNSFQDTKAARQAKLEKLTHKNIPDRDCGICFETAQKPLKTSCCGSLFCTDHLSDWLRDSEKSTCPACETRIVLASKVTSDLPTTTEPSSQTSTPVVSKDLFTGAGYVAILVGLGLVGLCMKS